MKTVPNIRISFRAATPGKCSEDVILSHEKNTMDLVWVYFPDGTALIVDPRHPEACLVQGLSRESTEMLYALTTEQYNELTREIAAFAPPPA